MELNLLNNLYDGLIIRPADISGWNSFSPVFETIIKKISPKTIVEVGSWKGASAINMANICKSLNLSANIYCIDTWLGSLEFLTTLKDTPERNLVYKNGYPTIYYQFLSNVLYSGNSDCIFPIPTTSSIGCKYLKYNNISPELIYIDASHEYDDVKSDILNYLSILPTNGIIFGDDYHSWGGVRQAVDEIFPSIQILDNNFWVYEKL